MHPHYDLTKIDENSQTEVTFVDGNIGHTRQVRVVMNPDGTVNKDATEERIESHRQAVLYRQEHGILETFTIGESDSSDEQAAEAEEGSEAPADEIKKPTKRKK